jgi:hypothetical protein
MRREDITDILWEATVKMKAEERQEDQWGVQDSGEERRGEERRGEERKKDLLPLRIREERKWEGQEVSWEMEEREGKGRGKTGWWEMSPVQQQPGESREEPWQQLHWERDSDKSVCSEENRREERSVARSGEEGIRGRVKYHLGNSQRERVKGQLRQTNCRQTDQEREREGHTEWKRRWGKRERRRDEIRRSSLINRIKED